MKTERLATATSGLRHVGASWRQFLLVGIITRTAVALVLFPGIALLLRCFLNTTGRGVLRDEEILMFFLSPAGITALLIVGGFWIGAALIEQAALMSIGLASAGNQPIKWVGALRLAASKLHGILFLGSHLLARTLLIAIPFIIPAVLVYRVFLGKHDINYYLNEHPPEFIVAAATITSLLAAMTGLLALKTSSWFFALPALLFENLRPAAAIRKSAADCKGHRLELLSWLFAWLAFGTLASFAITWCTGFIGRLLVSSASDSLEFIALIIGSVGVISIVANGVASIFFAALFAMIMVHLYRKYSGPGVLVVKDTDTNEQLRHRPLRISSKKFLVGLATTVVTILMATWFILSKMQLEDDVLIIAHRGASATAPENTMAAINTALDANSDVVEIDVQETAEGEVVVFHDSDFMKTARNPLKIWNAKRNQLNRIDIGSWFDPDFSSERTPSLTEVLRACKGRSTVDIELKYYGHDRDLERKVIEAVEHEQMADEVIVMSLKYDKVQKIKAMRPDWTYGLLTTISLGNISRFDVDFLGVSATAASRSFIRRAHKSGFKVYVWTVNDPFQMSAMMSRGADGIITDDPALARRVLEIRAGLNPVERLLIGIGTEVGVFTVPDELPAESDA